MRCAQIDSCGRQTMCASKRDNPNISQNVVLVLGGQQRDCGGGDLVRVFAPRSSHKPFNTMVAVQILVLFLTVRWLHPFTAIPVCVCVFVCVKCTLLSMGIVAKINSCRFQSSYITLPTVRRSKDRAPNRRLGRGSVPERTIALWKVVSKCMQQEILLQLLRRFLVLLCVCVGRDAGSLNRCRQAEISYRLLLINIFQWLSYIKNAAGSEMQDASCPTPPHLHHCKYLPLAVIWWTKQQLQRNAEECGVTANTKARDNKASLEGSPFLKPIPGH